MPLPPVSSERISLFTVKIFSPCQLVRPCIALTCCCTRKPLQVKGDLKAIGCRETWHVKGQDQEIAQNLIASKRFELDDVLSKVSGVQFFISSVTELQHMPKESSGNEAPLEDAYPATAYFIVFRETDLCSESKILLNDLLKFPNGRYRHGMASDLKNLKLQIGKSSHTIYKLKGYKYYLQVERL